MLARVAIAVLMEGRRDGVSPAPRGPTPCTRRGPPTPDKISAARLLRQSLTRLGQGVPAWVDLLASAEPVAQSRADSATRVNGVNILDENPGDEHPDGERDDGQ